MYITRIRGDQINEEDHKEAKKLYNQIRNLPYCEYEDDYEKIYKEILLCDLVNSDSKAYIQKRHEYREKYVKCYMKTIFTGGTCTTSRIESKHSVYKAFLNSDSSLMQVFQVFVNLEKLEFEKYTEEITIMNEKQNDFVKYDLIKELESVYSPYILHKTKANLITALNYGVEWITEPKKYFYFYLR